MKHLYGSRPPQVVFDEESARRACANSGSPDHMNRLEFMKFGKDYDLLDPNARREAAEEHEERHGKHGWEPHEKRER